MPIVLLVDDNAPARSVLARRLARRGYEVITAADGKAGVSLTRSAHPDVVLMDLDMPVMDGWQATRMVKANPHTQGIPVVVLTALSFEPNRLRAQEAGADAFCTKPVDFESLLSTLTGLLQPASP